MPIRSSLLYIYLSLSFQNILNFTVIRRAAGQSGSVLEPLSGPTRQHFSPHTLSTYRPRTTRRNVTLTTPTFFNPDPGLREEDAWRSCPASRIGRSGVFLYGTMQEFPAAAGTATPVRERHGPAQPIDGRIVV
ncbi:hypothetical protein CIRG_07662 [Coccidioides immitis RMSCC 2394]|uniref:Uncharacterized protein n=1 Tax=Coccidioides immitis RMSCC 2394 TaxID=404692 RepID=A0A0J6YH07_COCIT|nr:hypothetical protein CIRG_07662 [Coccidioides immitis RMSCC 2394]